MIKEILTKADLEKMEPGEIILWGEAPDAVGGLNMAGTGKILRWVALRGLGAPDWAIYCHFANADMNWIRRFGNKVHGDDNIRKLVPCTDEAFQLYRH